MEHDVTVTDTRGVHTTLYRWDCTCGEGDGWFTSGPEWTREQGLSHVRS